MNQIRKRSDKSRFLSLLVISFLIEFDYDQNELEQLTIDLEKNLPLESRVLLDGISYLFKRIAELLLIPYMPKIYHRCVQFLSNRATNASIQTAIIILSKIKPRENLNQLGNLLFSGIKFPEKSIQEKAVKLYFKCLLYSSHSDELAREVISTCTFHLHQTHNSDETYGIYLLIKRFLKEHYDVIYNSFDELFNSILDNLNKSHDYHLFELTAMMCEKFNSKTANYLEKVKTLFYFNWDLNSDYICQCLARIARVFPETFSTACYERAQNLCDSSYFTLISVYFEHSSQNNQEIIKKFQIANVTESYIDCIQSFLQTFPQYLFKIIPIITQKVDTLITQKDYQKCFSFIKKLQNLPIFPFEKYWDHLFSLFITDSLSIELKSQLILALLTILKHNEDKNDQYDKMKSLLFYVFMEDDQIFSIFLDNIDDILLPLFVDDSLRITLLSKQINSFNISFKSITSILVRLKNLSPLSTLNIFISFFKTIPAAYEQMILMSDKKNFVQFWSSVIQGGNQMIAPFALTSYEFSLKLVESKIPTPKNFKEQIEFRKILKDNVAIRIAAMEALDFLMKMKFEFNTQRIVDALINNLSLFSIEKYQICVLKTLRSVFRNFGIEHIDLIVFHKKLFDFMINSKSENILSSILSIFGTIGPLNPLSFHMHSEFNDEVFTLYDKTKREQVYLDFVMKYLLSQLKSSSDISLFLNAIFYIFQFDAHKSSPYLFDIIPLFRDLLNTETRDSIFHIIRSIILLVDKDIYPYTNQLLDLLNPYLTINNFNSLALKALSALVFALKNSFKPNAISTFSCALDLLSIQNDEESHMFLLQIMTHLVIFCNCSQDLLFQQIQQVANSKTINCSYALNFLSQVLLNTQVEHLCLPSTKLAMTLINQSGEIKKSAENLLSILYEKYSVYIPKSINITKMEKQSSFCEITADYSASQRRPPPIKAMGVTEVFADNKMFQIGNNIESWFLQVTQNLVLCSNSPAIRACHPILHMSASFRKQLFPLLLISVWENASKNDRQFLSDRTSAIAQNPKTPIEMLTILCYAADMMDRAGYTMIEPEVAGRIAVLSKHYFRAARFYEKSKNLNDYIKSEMILIHARLERKDSALGIFEITKKAQSNASILQELSIWDKAREHSSPYSNENDFIDYIYCCSKLEDWNEILKHTNRFPFLSTESKKSVANEFAIASTYYNMQNIDMFLPYLGQSTPRQCILQAIAHLHLKNYKAAKNCIDRGKKLNASNSTLLASGIYESTIPLIVNATFFEEITDVVNSIESPENKDIHTRPWNLKSDWIKTQISHLRTFYIIREFPEEKSINKFSFNFLNTARKLKAWSIYDNSIERFLATCNSDPRVDLLRAKVRYDRRQTKDLNEILDIIHQAKDNKIYEEAVCSYASRLSLPDDDLLKMLKQVIDNDPLCKRAWKHWAYSNLYGAHKQNRDSALNAIKGFTELIKLNGPCLHYLCQLLSLCFKYETSIDFFADLPPTLIEKVLQQLIAQINHPNEILRESIKKIIIDFAEKHMQALAYPMFYTEHCHKLISENITNFFTDLKNKYFIFVTEIYTILNGLLSVSFLEIEMLQYYVEKIGSIDNVEDIIPDLETINNLFSKTHSGINKVIDNYKQMRSSQDICCFLNQLKTAEDKSKISLQAFRNSLSTLLSILTKDYENITTVNIFEISSSLQDCISSTVAVPGFYDLEKPFPTIQSFSRIIKIIPSAKYPKKLRLTGSDGKCYKYLLKSKEDITLDKRVMEWFSISNSLMKEDKTGVEKNLSIDNYQIIPLSPLAGMIGWAEDSDTFYKLITSYHQMKMTNLKIDSTMNEYSADGLSLFGKDLYQMTKQTKIQHLEVYHELCKQINDDTLRESIWINSKSAENWFIQKTNFARSNGLMSIVGYVIGLGDRHPRNILFKNINGHAVHIDLSDCFEKAAKRKFCPEVVPFRLTRMMVKSFGISGVEGDFKITAKFVMNLLRRNKSALLAFFDIFAHDRENAPNEYNRVKDKLKGNDFEGENELSVETQVDKLIEQTTNEYNLSQMYYGWAPHW